MRRKLLARVLPIPAVDDWRVRADDCLVFGASLAGARKYYLAEPLVRYRLHGRNQFHGRAQNSFVKYRRRLAINTLFEHFRRKLGYDPQGLKDFLHTEFCTIERPSFRNFKQYAKLLMTADASLLQRFSRLCAIASYYVRSRIASPLRPTAGNHRARVSPSVYETKTTLPNPMLSHPGLPAKKSA